MALCVATTILVKMHRARYMWITCIPLVWLVVVTFTGGWQKIFSPLPRLGFLAQAEQLKAALAGGQLSAAEISQTKALIFNAQLDAVVCGIFLVLVAAILIDSSQDLASHPAGNPRSACDGVALRPVPAGGG